MVAGLPKREAAKRITKNLAEAQARHANEAAQAPRAASLATAPVLGT